MTVAELTSVGKASIVRLGGVVSRVTVRLSEPWLPAASVAVIAIEFAPSASDTGTSNEPSAWTIAGMPATVTEDASLTTPDTTVRSFDVRRPAELLRREIAGAVASLTTVSEVEAVFPSASVALTSIVFVPAIRVTAELNAPAPSTKTLDPPIDTVAPGSVVPLTVTVAADVTRPGVGDEMSSRGAVVSIENDHAVVARFPAKSPAWTIIV